MISNVIILILIPPISGLIGWLTNYIAVKMIFRPRKRITFLGLSMIGLIPKRKEDLARKIGETVESELISHKDIQKIITTDSFHEEVLHTIMGAVDRFVEQKLCSYPLIAMFLSAETTEQIKELLRGELRTILPTLMEEMLEKVEKKINFKEIVQQKIIDFDLVKLESIIYKIASKELKAIEIFGGILGFGVGLIQVALLLTGSSFSQ